MTSGREPGPEELAPLDEAPCGLMRTSRDGTIQYVNRTFSAWVGTPREALVGRRRFQDLLTMGGRIFHQTHFAPLLQMQGSISEVKLEIVHADGSTIPMLLNALRHEREGVVVHEIAAFISRDRDKYERELVAARRRLEEAVAETERLRAQAADRALFAEQMIGIVSHDLRNPLSAIGMGASILMRTELTDAQRLTANRIVRSTERAARLIGDLLDFTQARLGGGLKVQTEPTDLHRVVAETVDELTVVYPDRKLIHQRAGEGACSADSHRLVQLIGNLVSNAVAYGTPERPILVTSSISETSFSTTVHNDGVPIPDATQATIFEPMTRGTDVRAQDRSVGLGLFIVRQIAEAHGGRAFVTSSASEGTTFGATFPRV